MAHNNRVIRLIRQIAKERGESPMEVKAAFATGIVESGLQNLAGGDADSEGWRQERKSLYKNPRNLRASINRFFDETSAVQGKYGTAGALAAAVQRPAAQYRGRYQDVSDQAQALLEGSNITGGGNGSAVSTTSTSTQQPESRVSKMIDVFSRMNQNLRNEPINTLGLNQQEDPLQDQLDTNWATLQKMIQEKNRPQATQAQPSTAPSPGGAKGIGGRLLEAFLNAKGAVNVDENKRVPLGFVPGHTGHYHVAAGPKSTLSIMELARKEGLVPGEYGATEGHNPKGFHPKKQAVDVTDPRGGTDRLVRFSKRIAKIYGIR